MVPAAGQGPKGIAFLGNLYAFGAMLSFTIAHLSVIALRLRRPDPDMPFRAPLNLRVGRYDVPLFAILGGIGTFTAFVVTSTLFPAVRYTGLIWMALGMTIYVVYRKTQGLPLTKTVIAPPRMAGPAIEIEFKTIVLHITDAAVADEMTVTALRLAGEQGARVVALYALEVPADQPLLGSTEGAEAVAAKQLAEAEAFGVQYGVAVIGRLVRTRHPGRTLVEEALARNSEVIVLGSPGRSPRAARMFGETVDYVLRNASCKVMVGASPDWRGPQRASRVPSGLREE
jgi:APA family basic amino acid/polyamine antiporter